VEPPTNTADEAEPNKEERKLEAELNKEERKLEAEPNTEAQ